MTEIQLEIRRRDAQSERDNSIIHIGLKNTFNAQNTALTDMTIKLPSEKYGGKPSMIISFDAQYGTRDRSSLVAEVKAHLEAEKIPYKIEGSRYNDREFLLKFENCEIGDLAKIAGALSTRKHLDQGKIAHPIIPQSLVMAIASAEAEAGDGQTNAYTVRKIDATRDGDKEQRHYIDYECNITGAVIVQLQENSFLYGVGDEEAHVFTEIFLGKDAGTAYSQIIKSMDKKCLLAEKTGETIRVHAESAIVAQALSAQALIPKTAIEALSALSQERGEPKPLLSYASPTIRQPNAQP